MKYMPYMLNNYIEILKKQILGSNIVQLVVCLHCMHKVLSLIPGSI